MPSFVHPSLLWGLLLVGLPVLIHLINMLRQKRVHWAAMEFLLQSERKNRTWVLLKQLLLLLLRVGAIAAVVLMVAQPIARRAWSALVGGGRVHHIVLVDDSFSMSDRWAGATALDRAEQALRRLAENAGRENINQVFTVLRFSQAGRLAEGRQPDLLKQPIGSDFGLHIEEVCQRIQPTEVATGPSPALRAIEQLLGETSADTNIVYIFSDFRAKDWDDAGELRKALERITAQGAKLHLVHCADEARPNLAIAQLSPTTGTRAAGVPLVMNVAVTNFGDRAAQNVSVLLEEDGQTRPGVVIEEIGPGATERREISVQFASAGQHRLKAQLPADTVEADNARYAVLDLPPSVPVLVIDGDPAGQQARFLVTALAPGGSVRTGIEPRIESPKFLRGGVLNQYASVYLLNVPRLDIAEVENLEAYVRSGGGVAVFMGDAVRPEAYNTQLYREGEGLLPAPLAGPSVLLVNRLEKTPDLEVSDHPVFQVFTGERNSFIHTVLVERYMAVAAGWKPPEESTAKVIARLRNGAPLAIEQQFGRGRVLSFLTSAAPTWNNWARNNPSYVVAMLELQAYLAGPSGNQGDREVGTPLQIELEQAAYAPQVRLVAPSSAAARTTTAKAVEDRWRMSWDETDAGGFYDVELVRNDGQPDLRTFAYNVMPAEGNLKLLEPEQFAGRLAGVEYESHAVEDFQYSARELAGINLSDSLLYLLIGLLIGEQVLAYSASYHPARRGGV